MPSNLHNVLETSSDKVTLEQTEPGPVSRTLAVCKNVSKTLCVCDLILGFWSLLLAFCGERSTCCEESDEQEGGTHTSEKISRCRN